MYSAGAGWLMAMLAPDPVMVSLVQVSTSLPIVLFALPAGALADIADRRRLLIAFESAFTLASSIFAVLVSRDEVTPATLLLFTFVIGTCGALATPAWQAIVPELVPKSDLRSAIAANSVGINVSRAIGPAFGGLLAVWSGIPAPFWVNAVSNLGVIGVLVWWRSPPRVRGHLPPERFASSIRVGICVPHCGAH
jgi:MFS family permease